MNKTTLLSFVLPLLFCLTSFSQGHETFDNVAISGNSYQDGTFQGQDGSTWTYMQARGSDEITGQAIMLGRNRSPDSYVASGTIPNGIGTLQFSYKQPFATNVNMEVYVNEVLVYTATTNNQKDEVLITEEIEVNIPGDVVITFENPSSAGQVTIDDVIWTSMGQAPTLNIISPLDNTEFSPLETPSIHFEVNHFDISTSATAADGDGYVQYKVDQESFIDHFSTGSIALNNLSSGNHEVTLQLVDNHGVALNPEVSKSVNFSSNQITEKSSIGELRNSSLNKYYTLTEEVVLSFQQEYRGQKYIQDATGAILINDVKGILTKEYNLYDGITGISGELQEENGSKLFVPIIDANPASSSGNSIPIAVLSISDYMSNPAAYESQVIAFENVHFIDADGTELFATGQNYNVSDGNDIVPMRTNFYNADYIGATIPIGTQVAISGIASHYNGYGQLFSRDTKDIDGTSLSVKNLQKQGVSIYPNPATDRIYVDVNSNAIVEVFSILGEQVIRTQISDKNTAISLQDLNSGVYMVKITHKGKATAKKLIIK